MTQASLDFEGIDWKLMLEMAKNQNHKYKYRVWFEDVIQDAVVKVMTKRKPDSIGWVTFFLNTVRYMMMDAGKSKQWKVRKTSDEEPSTELNVRDYEKYLPLLDKQQQMVYTYLMLGYDGKEIGLLLGHTPQNVSLIRKKIQNNLREYV